MSAEMDQNILEKGSQTALGKHGNHSKTDTSTEINCIAWEIKIKKEISVKYRLSVPCRN